MTHANRLVPDEAVMYPAPSDVVADGADPLPDPLPLVPPPVDVLEQSTNGQSLVVVF